MCLRLGALTIVARTECPHDDHTKRKKRDIEFLAVTPTDLLSQGHIWGMS